VHAPVRPPSLAKLCPLQPWPLLSALSACCALIWTTRWWVGADESTAMRSLDAARCPPPLGAVPRCAAAMKVWTHHVSVSLISQLRGDLQVQNEDATHFRLLAFNHLWTTHCAATPGSLLVFSTGRSPTLFAKLWEEAPLLTPGVANAACAQLHACMTSATWLYWCIPVDEQLRGTHDS
jgi:hypothetical protein